MGILNIILTLVPISLSVALTYVMLTRHFNDNQLRSIQLMSTILCFVSFIILNMLEKGYREMTTRNIMLSYISVFAFLAASGILFLKNNFLNNKQIELMGVLGLIALFFISSNNGPLPTVFYISSERYDILFVLIHSFIYELYLLLKFLIVFTAAKRYKQNNN